MITRTFKIKLYPTKQQMEGILKHAGATRFIYNRFLNIQKMRYSNGEFHLSNFSINKEITLLKNDAEYEWLNEIDSQVLQQSAGRLALAYQAFFRKLKSGEGVHLPRFKSRKDSSHSFTYPQRFKFNEVKNKVYLPKIGWVKCRGFREFKNPSYKTLTVVVSRDGYVYASCAVECENQATPITNSNIIGLDMGTRKFVTDSNGTKIKPLNLKQELKKIDDIQRRLSRSTKDSNNRERLVGRLVKQYRRISNIKLNWLHHISLLHVNNKYIFVEDLVISRMVKNTAGTIDNPNIDSKRKSNLNRAILTQSWGMYFDILKYKNHAKGGLMLKVDPVYSSQECSVCHIIDATHRDGEHYRCSSCGNEEDADFNASKNIRNRGIVFCNLTLS